MANREAADNYSGVAVLPTLSKLPEKIINISLNEYLYHNALLNQNQFGFIRKSNTLAAVTSLTTCIRQKLDELLKVGAVYLDLKKAFDCVNHTLLVQKLASIAVTGLELNLFKNSLN